MASNVLHLDVPTAPTLSTVVAANIKAELAYLDRRHGDLARALGLTQAAVSMKLRGERAIGLDELEPIAEYLGVSVLDLLTPRGQRPTGPAHTTASSADSTNVLVLPLRSAAA